MMIRKAKSELSRRRSLSDPLAAALQPPPNESPVQREQRLQAENDAKKVSDNIDDMIRRERAERKREKADTVNILLLGQSESGKSTTLKQFQLHHNKAAFSAERLAWRTVIYLNLVRSVMRILDALQPEQPEVFDEPDDDGIHETNIITITSSGRPQSALSETQVPNYDSYRAKLAPLIDLEDRLIRLLANADDDEPTRLPSNYPSEHDWNPHPMPYTVPNGTPSKRPQPTIMIPRSLDSSQARSAFGNGVQGSSKGNATVGKHKGKEVSIHTSKDWKKGFTFGGGAKSPKSAHTGEIDGWWEDPEDPVHVLYACSATMIDLWRDPKVKQRLKEKRIRLEESSGFYLNEIHRITAKKYIPTNDDILRARLKTTGVIEHTFHVFQATGGASQWHIYDVGGSRNQRQAWAPYFEDVNAIIFLAPISAFDQVLAEDPSVNRLQDSLELWQKVVSNPLLAQVNIILFLNKIDLLRSKLEANVRLSHYLEGYNQRNDFETVSKYFKAKFVALHHRHTPNKEREIYIHFTTVTDTRKTNVIIASVRDIIIKANLRTMKLV